MDTAGALNLSGRPLRLELEELALLKTPSILHWNLNHFVVLAKVLPKGKGIVIHDPAMGMRRVSMTEVSRCFTGVALELVPTSQFERKQIRQYLNLRALLGGVVGLKRSLAQILLLAFALEIFSIASPFFMQLVVDGAIASADTRLLTTLALGFGLLMIVQTSVGLVRTWVVMYMAIHLNLQWVTSVFTHLVRLPMSYFEKRTLGDVVSRFGSIGNIQRTLTTNFVEAIVDGVMAIATLCMMLVYSVKLSFLVFATILFYALLHWCSYTPFRRASEQQIVLQAREQTLFLESIRGIQSIKLFNHEDMRCTRWVNALVGVTNRSIATQKMSLGFGTAHSFIAGIEGLLIVWLGARLVIANEFSLGMLYAFISYKSTFGGRIYSLIDKWVDLKMLSLQGDRLSDIVLTAKEGHQKEPSQNPRGAGFNADIANTHDVSRFNDTNIEVRNVSFRYSDGEPWVLRDLSFRICSGESIAITGPSGCGKTTLIKLLTALLVPTSGEIIVGGVVVNQTGLRSYRDFIGVVMQEDQLLSGSVTDNISFFDLYPDQAWAEACAETAGIAREIGSMPMGYQTLIGDMGSSLSGGQKQRILLARALYKRPKILFLDEATSHLDVAKEVEINGFVNKLSITRVIVAHRPDTIRSASRVITLNDGLITGDLRNSMAAVRAGDGIQIGKDSLLPA
jgi:ATP-binding cassette subfamily B protein RaxB